MKGRVTVMLNRAFVLDKNRQPLMPCPMHRAKELLGKGRAAIYRRAPFTIILKEREGGVLQEIELKTDPGSRTTGIALVARFQRGNTVIWAGELQHHGLVIRKALDKRRALRRGRRSRKTRYRPARFDNRIRPVGWLPPSLRSRVDNVRQWAERLCRWAPVTSIVVETVRFDMQQIVNPEISGVEYQQGELAGYELREYLLEKFGRKCIYCGAENVPLEVEHLTPRSRQGSNRVSNLGLSCRPCNVAKGNMTAAEFGHPEVQALALRPLRDAAAVNATRYAIGNSLKQLGLPVTFWSGGRTKYNRTRQHHPKAHWIDAACVGTSGQAVHLDPDMKLLEVKSLGRGNRQTCRVDKYGFSRTGGQAVKRVQSFQTGDLVRLYMPKGKYAGYHTGRIAGVRATGILDIESAHRPIGFPSSSASTGMTTDGAGDDDVIPAFGSANAMASSRRGRARPCALRGMSALGSMHKRGKDAPERRAGRAAGGAGARGGAAIAGGGRGAGGVGKIDGDAMNPVGCDRLLRRVTIFLTNSERVHFFRQLFVFQGSTGSG